FFWYGATEPHQAYDVGAWKRHGKRLEDARLPGGLPDHPVTRGEILDYGLEIEHFDQHLARMLAVIEGAGELDNTVVLVTSDHGNPLPRSKCNLYDSGTRVPLAVRWPGKIPAAREVDDFVSLMDIAPTLLEVASLQPPREMSARSFLPTLRSSASGLVDKARDFVVTAFERHTIARRNGEGYPMRSIRTHRYSYIRNYEPSRWPAGDPDYASSHQGFYGDIDRGESKRMMMEQAYDPKSRPYFLRAFGRRPAEELYDMERDPNQHHNLATEPSFAVVKRELKQRLERYLTRNGDPRMRGVTPWDNYEFTGRSIYDNPNWRTEGRPTPLKPRQGLGP
ncbi:MAG: sulfatase-like hydrolase/transferase, partial [bacterium]|nr:sulfatase-like hydrolase/transferase [bacterium]